MAFNTTEIIATHISPYFANSTAIGDMLQNVQSSQVYLNTVKSFTDSLGLIPSLDSVKAYAASGVSMLTPIAEQAKDFVIGSAAAFKNDVTAQTLSSYGSHGVVAGLAALAVINSCVNIGRIYSMHKASNIVRASAMQDERYFLFSASNLMSTVPVFAMQFGALGCAAYALALPASAYALPLLVSSFVVSELSYQLLKLSYSFEKSRMEGVKGAIGQKIENKSKDAINEKDQEIDTLSDRVLALMSEKAEIRYSLEKLEDDSKRIANAVTSGITAALTDDTATGFAAKVAAKMPAQEAPQIGG